MTCQLAAWPEHKRHCSRFGISSHSQVEKSNAAIRAVLPELAKEARQVAPLRPQAQESRRYLSLAAEKVDTQGEERTVRIDEIHFTHEDEGGHFGMHPENLTLPAHIATKRRGQAA